MPFPPWRSLTVHHVGSKGVLTPSPVLSHQSHLTIHRTLPLPREQGRLPVSEVQVRETGVAWVGGLGGHKAFPGQSPLQAQAIHSPFVIRLGTDPRGSLLRWPVCARACVHVCVRVCAH